MSVRILIINLLIVSPELMAERSEIKENVKSWDKVLATLISILTLSEFVMSGLDKRFGWSSQPGLAIHLVALVFYALGQGLFSWAMASNKFFSSTIRIQMDRNHVVVTDGPYRYVRHPGYFGTSSPFVLQPLWPSAHCGHSSLGVLERSFS